MCVNIVINIYPNTTRLGLAVRTAFKTARGGDLGCQWGGMGMAVSWVDSEIHEGMIGLPHGMDRLFVRSVLGLLTQVHQVASFLDLLEDPGRREMRSYGPRAT